MMWSTLVFGHILFGLWISVGKVNAMLTCIGPIVDTLENSDLAYNRNSFYFFIVLFHFLSFLFLIWHWFKLCIKLHLKIGWIHGVFNFVFLKLASESQHVIKRSSCSEEFGCLLHISVILKDFKILPKLSWIILVITLFSFLSSGSSSAFDLLSILSFSFTLFMSILINDSLSLVEVGDDILVGGDISLHPWVR